MNSIVRIINGINEEGYESNTLRLPYTPSEWISQEPTYIDVTMITMSCGGGIGGSRWNEYIERMSLEDIMKDNKFIATTWDGKQILINSDYIVKANNEYKIATAIFNNENKNFELGLTKIVKKIPNNNSLCLV